MTSSPPAPRADIAVLGGSGFYSFLADAEPVAVATPFGPPSDEIHVGEIEGRPVAFLSRHGHGHRYPAHLVNYRANLWALRSVGVRQIVSACAVGSLDPQRGAGSVIVPDQIIDRTWGRQHTVYDQIGRTVHVGFADPFCPTGRAVAVAARGPDANQSDAGADRASTGDRPGAVGDPDEAGPAVAGGGDTGAGLSPVVDGGTIVVINGPRFSTRAEARWHRQAGATIVGMTSMPEAAIARELALCYTSVCLVTDLDAGVGPDDAVTHAGVMEAFAANMPRFTALVGAIVAGLPATQDDDLASCPCRRSLDGLRLPFDLP